MVFESLSGGVPQNYMNRDPKAWEWGHGDTGDGHIKSATLLREPAKSHIDN